MLKGFKKFILRGNVVDLAVGIVVGAAFTSVVNALVKDLITPLIAAFIKAPDFSGLSFTFRGSNFLYGEFLNAVISFLIASAAVYFFVVLPLNKFFAKPQPEPTTKKCPDCTTLIPKAARRCPNCTSIIDIEENEV